MCYGAPGTSASKISVHLDSGPIDSTLDLVINAPPQDRVTLQRLLKYAPLWTDGFRSLKPQE